MLNSRLYKLRHEFIESLKELLDMNYVCTKCLKKETKSSIYKEKREWFIKSKCSCGADFIYSIDQEYKGYVDAQYKHILKKNFPKIKIRIIPKKKSEYIPPAKPTKVIVQKEPPKEHVFKGKKPLKRYTDN